MTNEQKNAIRQRCMETNPDMSGDPGLADVLFALNVVRPYLRIHCTAAGRFNTWDERTKTYTPGAIWHLRLDTLDQQSASTLGYLHDLLSGH